MAQRPTSGRMSSPHLPRMWPYWRLPNLFPLLLPAHCPVKVVLKNNGTATLTSADIDWEVNGAAQTTFNWTGSLASGGVDTVSVGTNAFAAGTAYNLKAYASNPNGMADPQPVNDTIYADSLYTGLAGIYTIGGSSPDFTDFTEAVDALHSGGVVGAVTFNVRNGTYNEQIEINEILGVDSMNTVIFQSETGDSTAAILAFSSSFNYGNTVYLNGCDWVTFHQLTIEMLGNSYPWVVYFGNNSFHNTLSSCVINAPANTYGYSVYSPNVIADYTTFSNNVFNNGGYGIYWMAVTTTQPLTRPSALKSKAILSPTTTIGPCTFLTSKAL